MRSFSYNDKNRTYVVEIDGEVFETYIPSPEEEAARILKAKYGQSILEEQFKEANAQRRDMIENQQRKWGEPKRQ